MSVILTLPPVLDQLREGFSRIVKTIIRSQDGHGFQPENKYFIGKDWLADSTVVVGTT
jgi:hypothetical protein